MRKAFRRDWVRLHCECSRQCGYGSLAGDGDIINSSVTVKTSQFSVSLPALEGREGRACGKSPASLGTDGRFQVHRERGREREVILGWLAVTSFLDCFQALPGQSSLSSQVEPGLQSSKALLRIMPSQSLARILKSAGRNLYEEFKKTQNKQTKTIHTKQNQPGAQNPDTLR